MATILKAVNASQVNLPFTAPLVVCPLRKAFITVTPANANFLASSPPTAEVFCRPRALDGTRADILGRIYIGGFTILALGSLRDRLVEYQQIVL